jgi:hypothetical protein
MRKRMLVVLAVLGLLAVTVVPAFAVTDGEPDGDGHPAVKLLLMEIDGEPAYRCSGTLLAPQVFLTAGHCAGAPGEFSGMRVFTESDVQGGIGTTNNYPFAGPNAVEAIAWSAHPDYTDSAFFVHDVGVVILDAPGIVLPASEYGRLPAIDQFDSLKTQRGHKDLTFTAVGYGLQKSFPDAASWKDVAYRTRYVATPHLIQINTPGFTGDFSMLLSNNANTGGTCFGDSGGPNFYSSGSTETKVVAGVTSFGLNGTCGGTGGVFRMDRQNVQDFICGFVAAHLAQADWPVDCQ